MVNLTRDSSAKNQVSLERLLSFVYESAKGVSKDSSISKQVGKENLQRNLVNNFSKKPNTPTTSSMAKFGSSLNSANKLGEIEKPNMIQQSFDFCEYTWISKFFQ